MIKQIFFIHSEVKGDDCCHRLPSTLDICMVHGNAKDLTVPPPNDEEFAFLARRLNYGNDLARLQDDLTRHMAVVQELSEKLLVDN